MTLREQIQFRFQMGIPRQILAVVDRLEEHGVTDLITDVVFPYIGNDANYIMLSLNGESGSVTLGFSSDTGMFRAIIAPDRTHPQSEILDSLDMDDPTELVGLVSTIKSTLYRSPTTRPWGTYGI